MSQLGLQDHLNVGRVLQYSLCTPSLAIVNRDNMHVHVRDSRSTMCKMSMLGPKNVYRWAQLCLHNKFIPTANPKSAPLK